MMLLCISCSCCSVQFVQYLITEIHLDFFHLLKFVQMYNISMIAAEEEGRTCE